MSAQVSLPSSVLTDTKWRNEITGDWDIAFFENFAVYDCKFWDYYSVNEKGDRFDIILRSNGYSPTTMISGTNHSLSPALMEMAEKRISLSIVKEGIRELNQKYLDIENRNQQSIKSSGMSLGESLFRKFTEPYKGKIILVDFWGTWCMPCIQALSKSQEESGARIPACCFLTNYDSILQTGKKISDKTCEYALYVLSLHSQLGC